MDEDAFAGELRALFDQAPPMADAEAFAAAVERRLEAASVLPLALRGGLVALGAAAAAEAWTVLSEPAGRIAGEVLALAGGIDPNLAWAAAGLAMAAVFIVRNAQEA